MRHERGVIHGVIGGGAVVAVLGLVAGLAGCDDDGGALCPAAGSDGPALNADRSWLLTAHGLSEDWLAVDVGVEPPAVRQEHGLTGRAPNDLDVVGDRLVVVNSGENTVSVFDLSTGRGVGCIAIGPNTNPWELFVDPEDSTRAWVTTFLSGEVVEVSLTALRVLRRAPVGATAEGLLVTGSHVAITLTGFDLSDYTYGQGYVVVLDKNTLAETARLPVPTNPQFLFSGADGRAHTVCTGDFNLEPGRVVRLEADGSAVRDTLTLGGAPARALLAGDGTAYLAGYLGGVLAYDTVSFVSIHDAEDPVVAGVGFTALAAAGGRLYAANFDADAVTVVALDTGATLGTIPVSDGPVALAMYPSP